MFGRHLFRISTELAADLIREYSSRIEVQRKSIEASERHFISTGTKGKNLALLGFQASPYRASDKGS
jgi:hypothetical protein